MYVFYEIRPCIDNGEETASYLGQPDPDTGLCSPERAYAAAVEGALAFDLDPQEIFWTLYGVTDEGPSEAIGDFKTFDAAHKTLSSILAPMRQVARLILRDGNSVAPCVLFAEISSTLANICNKSSGPDRI